MNADQIIIEIENKNLTIESILNKGNKLDLVDIDKILNLYSEKKELINSFMDKKLSSDQNEFDKNPDYWKKKISNYLEHDKSLVDKLNEKVKIHADLLKNSVSNKKLLIYSRV